MSLVVEEGAEALIDCTTEGLPKPRVYWVFNGHNVHEDGNLQITGRNLCSDVLSIHNVQFYFNVSLKNDVN